MLCPQCQNQDYSVAATLCANCGFEGDGRLLESLSNLSFLINESQTWTLARTLLEPIQNKYEKQKRDVEVTLGLRQPPPDPVEAKLLRDELENLTALSRAVSTWLGRGWMDVDNGLAQQIDLKEQIKQLHERLQDAPPNYESTSQQKQLLHRWEQLNFVRQSIKKLYADGLMTELGYRDAMHTIGDQIGKVEIRAGLREKPKPKPAPVLATAGAGTRVETAVRQPVTISEDEIPAQPSSPPRESWTWDRFWDNLLSERTLKAILFLGALLMAAAAVSWVASNWGEFTALTQGTFLVGVTAVFYGLGWYVRKKQGLHESGVAITAVASFLVPLDFLVYYLSGGFPAESWPTVWLTGSIVCIGLYLVMTVSLQAEFFGYLVAIAAGSLTLSILNWVNVPFDWWLTGAAGAAFIIAMTSELCRRADEDWHVFVAPFSRMSLLGVVPVMLIGLGWGYFVGRFTPAFYTAIGLAWWLGGFTFLLMVRHYRLRSLVWVTAVIFPVAMWLLLNALPIDHAYFALGWAILAPIYLAGGYLLWQEADDNELAEQLRTIVLRVGWLLVAIAAFWPITNPAVARWVHLWLAVTMVLYSYVWQRPRALWLSSLFLMMGATMWQGSAGAASSEVTLSWSLLAILHVATAVWLDGLGNSKQYSVISSQYTAPLFGAGITLAALAVLPPFLFNDGQLLTYAVGNWVGVNGWLAFVASGRQHAGLQQLLTHRRLARWPVLRVTVFHWLTAVPLVLWLFLLWTNNNWDRSGLAIAFAVLAWGMMFLGLRLRRTHWFYGKPWLVAAHFGIIGSIIYGVNIFESGLMAIILLSAAFFYFTSAWKMSLWQKQSLFVGGLLFPIGWVLGLEKLGVLHDGGFLFPALAIVPLAYVVVAMWLEQSGRVKQGFLLPLDFALLLISYGVFVLGLGGAVVLWEIDFELMRVGLAYLLLGVTFLLYGWRYNLERWGHVGIWTGVLGGGLFIKAYSHGSGRSAMFAAFLAIGLILAERGLRYLAIHHQEYANFWRRGWQLYKRPLRFAGWAISVGTIGMALVRNLILLEGGVTRQTYSIIALLLITGLYAASAYLYKKAHFLWFASVLLIAPWLLLANLRWYADGRLHPDWYGMHLVILGLVLLGCSLAIRKLEIGDWRFYAPMTHYQFPPWLVAQVIVPIGLLIGLSSAAASSVTMLLGIGFYGTAVWMDAIYRQKADSPSERFLYPTIYLLPAFAVATLFWIAPMAEPTSVGLLILAFVLPLLAVGRWVRGWEPNYQWPLYVVAYSCAVIATVIVSQERPFFILFLFFSTALTIFSSYLFRKPMWLVVATALFPWAVGLTLWEIGVRDSHYFAWLFSGIGGLYLVWTWILRELNLARYSRPLLVAMFGLVTLGIVTTMGLREGEAIGYGLAALVWGITAVWLRLPILMTAVAPLLAVTYFFAVEPSFNNDYFWFTFWPLVAAFILVGWWLDSNWGLEPKSGQPKRLPNFSWYRFWRWPQEIWVRLNLWWALPFHLIVLMVVGLISMLNFLVSADLWQVAVAFGLATAVYTYYLFQFRIRGLLIVAWLWFQFSYMATLVWLFPEPKSFAQVALAFMPMTILTAVMGVLVQQLRHESAPFGGGFKQWWFGWSRPFYAILAINLFISQLMVADGDVGLLVTLFNAAIIGTLATIWHTGWLLYLPLALGWLAAWQYGEWQNLSRFQQPIAYSIVATVYGIIGYACLYWQKIEEMALRAAHPIVQLWQRPLRYTAWFISSFMLLVTLAYGSNLLVTLPFAIFDLPVFNSQTVREATLLISVFSVLGLFYLAAAFVERRRWLGYGSVFLLLGAWGLWLFYIQQQVELQLYALPAGIYLLALGWLEWQQGSRNLATWVDRTAVFLLLGSAFWQSFQEWGILYAVLMIFEGIGLVWWGSVRRLKRLLYAGVLGVVTAVIGQLIEPLFNLETYIFFILGAGLLAAGILIEQRREKVLKFAQELQIKLEDWE